MCREDGVVHTCWASLGSQAATLGQASLGLLIAPAPGMLQLCGYFWNEVSYLLQSLHLNILHRTLFYYRRFVIATCLYSYWNVALRDEAKQRCSARLAVLAFDRIMHEAVALIADHWKVEQWDQLFSLNCCVCSGPRSRCMYLYNPPVDGGKMRKGMICGWGGAAVRWVYLLPFYCFGKKGNVQMENKSAVG